MSIKNNPSIFRCSYINNFQLSPNSTRNSIIPKLYHTCRLIMKLEHLQSLVPQLVLFIQLKESTRSGYQSFNRIQIYSEAGADSRENEG